MKKSFLLLLMLQLALSTSAFAGMKALDGYGGIKWNDGIEVLKDPVCTKDGDLSQCIRKTDVDRGYVTTYNFRGNKLESFNVQSKNLTGLNQTLLHLEDVFGSGWKEITDVKVTVHKGNSPKKRIFRWKIEDAVILLMGSDDTKENPVVIVLQKPKGE